MNVAADRRGSTPPLRQTGAVSLICGCMFSGKTSALLKMIECTDQRSTRIFKHRIDRRYAPNCVVTHNGRAASAQSICQAEELLAQTESHVRLVAIDEAHFFDPRLPSVVRSLAARGIDVALTALDRDSWGRPFPVVQALADLADQVDRLTATCARCGEVADHTQRLTPITDMSMVGGPESYEPRCASCWRPPPEPHP